jgi:integrase
MRYAHKVFAQAVLDRHIRSNPVTEKPKVDVDLPDTFTAEETASVLEALKDSRYYVAFALQAVSGLRSGELLALSESDVVMPESGPGVVTVVNNWARAENGWELGKPKTRRGTRQVPIPETMVSLLREHTAKTAAERAKFGWPEDGALFVRELDGVRPDVQRLSAEFREAVKKCGLAEGRTLTPHHLRHSFITRLLVAGWAPTQVAAVAGHSAAVSINRYLGVVAASEVAGITAVTGGLLQG